MCVLVEEELEVRHPQQVIIEDIVVLRIIAQLVMFVLEVDDEEELDFAALDVLERLIVDDEVEDEHDEGHLVQVMCKEECHHIDME